MVPAGGASNLFSLGFGEQHPDICAKFDVFSVPVFLLYVDKKESLRIGRNVDLLELECKIQRYYEMIYEK